MACPSASEIGDVIRKEVESGMLYKGLKSAQKLIVHESNLLQSLGEEIEVAVSDQINNDEV